MRVEGYPLPSRFRRAMLYVIQQLGNVGATKLQKILYLADLEHYDATGTILTGARWVRYTHGPMAKALLPSTELMDGHEITVTEETAGPYPTRIYRPGPAPRFSPDLAREERDALDRIVALTRDLTAAAAIELAYNTGPMRAMLLIERGREPLIDQEISFEVPDEILVAATLPEASQHTPDEVAAFKRAEYRRFAGLAEAALER